MGAFIVNFNVRSSDRAAVEHALREQHTPAAWVTAPKNGWITVYDENASTQDERRIRELGTTLSAVAPVVALLVHDSDVLCYWLYESGTLVDEYNSCPDYFADSADAPGPASGGRPGVLLKYCAAQKQLADVEQVLGHTKRVFAEEQLEELADLLGMDQTRARMDFEFIGREMSPAELDAVYVGTEPPTEKKPATPGLRIAREEDEDAGPDDKLAAAPQLSGMGNLSQMLQALGMGKPQAPADPQVQALVEAAAENNLAEIDRLAAAGTDINGQAPLKPKSGAAPLRARMIGGFTAMPATPLLAAIAHRHLEATRRLLALGADLTAQNPLLGTPVHAAACGGRTDLLRVVLDAGGDPNALNARGQTPLDSLAQIRTVLTQMTKLGPLAAAIAGKLSEQMKNLIPSEESLVECEALLRERGGR